MATYTDRSDFEVQVPQCPHLHRRFKSRRAAQKYLSELSAGGHAGEIRRSRGGPWRVRVRRAGRPALSANFTTRREAEQWAYQQEVALSEGSYADPRPARRHTLGDLLERYQLRIPADQRSDEPEWHRCNALRRHRISQVRLSLLSASDLAQYRDARAKVVKPTSVSKEMDLIHKVLEWGRHELSIHLPSNPASAKCVERPKPHKGHCRDRRLQLGNQEVAGGESEAVRLLRAARQRKLGCREGHKSHRAGNAALLAFLRLSLATAARRGELLSLKWTDVSLAKGYLLLRAETTKNGHARLIPLTRRAHRVLSTLPRSGERVFEGQTAASIACAYRRVRNLAGIGDLRMHDLRHEAISRLFEQTDLRESEIAAISGHRDHRMLARYTHLRPEWLVSRFNSSFHDASDAK